MKIAYVFAMPRSASYKLAQMILPQLEAGTHGVEVVGMFFFDDNVFVLRKGDPVGERLAKVAQPGEVRVKDTVAGVTVGCFPDLYKALSGNPPDQVITL